MTTTKPYAALFDLDGTLFNIDHRLHFIKGTKKDYDGFFAAIPGDTPKENIWDLLYMVWGDGTQIFFVSGRGEECRTASVLQLAKKLEYLLPKHYTEQEIKDYANERLFMRSAGDHRPDYIIKEEIYRKHIEPYYDVRFVVDDRQSVVDMWRRIGLTCLQCEQWDDSKGHKPVPADSASWPKLLHLMVGPSGSGKSTYCAGQFPTWTVLASDDIRFDLCGTVQDQSKNETVFAALHAIAKARLDNGLPVCIDATNLRRKDRLACVALAPEGSIVTYHVIDRPFEDAWKSRDWRGDWIKRHYQTFDSQKAEILRGDDLPNVEVKHVKIEENKDAI